MTRRSLLPLLCALIIGVLAVLLYLPFLHNEVVFDDHGLFTSLTVFDYAQTPFDFRPRTFPYFTLGVVQVLFGSIEANRTASLILHMLCALMLFALLRTLVHQALKTSDSNLINEGPVSTQTTILAFIGAAWFAINPVAVYGAGYLVQRTILFATLFSLLSLWYYRRAFAENRTTDVVTAALFYSAAVFSKEHAIMLPAAAVALTALYSGNFRLNVKRAALYLLLCTPAAITALLSTKHIIATSYEPDASTLIPLIHGISLLNTRLGQWVVSIVMQMSSFFDYFGYWIVPDIRSMSADMRIDFTQTWAAWWLIPKATLFLASPLIALYLLRRRGMAALFGYGLLYSWLLFLTELAAIRFQEPFVLYRSYLWAPGYVLMLISLLFAIPRTAVLSIAGLVFPLFFFLAHDRLQSLANEFSLWQDAANKLSSKDIPGANRIFYNRGKQYFEHKKYAAAIQDFTDALPQQMYTPQIHYIRGMAYDRQHDYKNALADFNQAIIPTHHYKNTINLQQARVQDARGRVLEKMGCLRAAEQAFLASQNLGMEDAQVRKEKLNKKIHGSSKIPTEPIQCVKQTSLK